MIVYITRYQKLKHLDFNPDLNIPTIPDLVSYNTTYSCAYMLLIRYQKLEHLD